MTAEQRRPRYFHLLWDEDLDQLRPVLESIRERRAEVVASWYKLYVLHFGDERALSRSSFGGIFEPALLRNQDALLRKDMDGYAASVLMVGRQLVEQGVPLEELIAAVQLFEEAAQGVFPQDPPPSTAVFNNFDKLSHIRIILLVGAYTRLQGAAAANRVHGLELEARHLPPQERSRFHGLVGHSPAMRDLYRQVEAVACASEPLLIVGEAGTGKQLLARAIHEAGSRRDGPFTVLRCTALRDDLIESELFGYQRIAPDGSSTSYLGLYRAAEGGTLYIDEITAMPPEVQGRLARLIDDRSGKVRIVASSGRDPVEAASAGQVCDGLFAHLRHHIIRVPPLRERVTDIVLLAQHGIDLLNQRTIRMAPIVSIDEGALQAMERYAWPGNVKELFEALEHAFGSAKSAVIAPGDLPGHISGMNGRNGPLPPLAFETFADAERGVLQRALEITGGNKVQAAKLLKISRKKLYSGIAKYNLKSPSP